MSKETAQYLVLATSYIGGQLVEPGAIIEYDGEPGTALEPQNAAAKAAAKIAEKNRKALVMVNPTIQALAQGIAALTKPQREELLSATGQGSVIDPGPDLVDGSPFSPGQNANQPTVPAIPLEAQDTEIRDPREPGDPALVQGSAAQAKAESASDKRRRELAEAQAKAAEKPLA